MLSVGQRFQGYEIIKPLSAGGMASLYLGRRVGVAGFKKLVAIKVVHPHLAKDETFVRMFLDEALLCARIQHPNVVHVEELGEEGGSYFLVMEFVHGVTLAQLLKALAIQGMWLAPEVAVSIVLSVADGLHAAHEVTGDDGEPLGVVHRDVSPQNVLLDAKGFVKLIDFGVAKSRSRVEQTQGGTLKGKFRYMAPEQARAKAVDRRTDVFALGIVLWEMLALRRMYSGKDEVELLLKAQQGRVSPPSGHNPGVSAELDAVVMRALSKDPRNRPATAAEFRAELASAVPAAVRVTSIDIGSLVRRLFDKTLRGRTQGLPESVSKVLHQETPTDPEDETRAKQLTVITETPVAYGDDEDEDGDGDEGVDGVGGQVVGDSDDDGAEAGAGVGGRGRVGWIAAGVGLAFLVSIGVGGAIASLEEASPESIEATDATDSMGGMIEDPEDIAARSDDETSAEALRDAAAVPDRADAGAASEAAGEVDTVPDDEASTSAGEPTRGRRGRRAAMRGRRTAGASMEAAQAMEGATGGTTDGTMTGMTTGMTTGNMREPTDVHGSPLAEDVPF